MVLDSEISVLSIHFRLYELLSLNQNHIVKVGISSGLLS